MNATEGVWSQIDKTCMGLVTPAYDREPSGYPEEKGHGALLAKAERPDHGQRLLLHPAGEEVTGLRPLTGCRVCLAPADRLC